MSRYCRLLFSRHFGAALALAGGVVFATFFDNFAKGVPDVSEQNDKKTEETFEPGYPNDPPIDVCPREVAEFRTFCVYEFDKPSDFVGWTKGPAVALVPADQTLKTGTLKIIATENDPYFFSPDLDKVVRDANGSYQTLSGTILAKLRMKNTTTGGGQFFSAEVDAPGYSEEKSSRFTLQSDGEYCEYLVPIETKSPLLRLRLDPGLDKGEIEIDRLELIQVVYKPVKFGVYEIDDDKLSINLANNGTDPVRLDARYFGVETTKTSPKSTVEIATRGEIDLYYPQKKPFEEIEVVATAQGTGAELSRRFFAFHEKVADRANDANATENTIDSSTNPTLKSESVEIRFASDASGAEVFRDGKRIAVLFPLIVEDADGAQVVPARLDPNDETQNISNKEVAKSRIQPVFRSIDDSKTEIEFDLCDLPRDVVRKTTFDSAAFPVADVVAPKAIRGSLRFRLNGDVLSFEVDSPRPVHSPVVRPLGTMKQAILSGVEYLESGERSSSTADLETSESVRFAPPQLWLTAPFASVVSERGSVSLLFDDPDYRTIFAVPNFVDGDVNSSRFNVFGKKLSGKIRFASVEPIENAILWSVQERGLPELPPRIRDAAAEDALNLAAFERSNLKMEGGWAHAVGSGLPTLPFDPHFGSDFLSTIWELTGELPKTPRFDVGGGHIRNYASFLIAGKADKMLSWLDGEAAAIRSRQQSDGSFRYSGKYLKGHWTNYASGDCANNLFRLLEHWRLTGDQDSLNAAIKGLEFVDKIQTPRGAQVWELSLHTPDIMGSSRCVLANVFAFEATGDQKYIDAARRWALTGIPFVYLWEKRPLAGNTDPIMLYATTPVLGATNWIAPNWIGLPVQWCGLDYSYALLLLSQYDETLDWRKIAEGILLSAEEQQYPDGEFVGLLPDSFQLPAQLRTPYNINPCVVHLLRRIIDGRPTNVSVVDFENHRVISPYPARVEDGVLKISAKAGVEYQIVVDGKEIRTIRSKGEDVVSLEK